MVRGARPSRDLRRRQEGRRSTRPQHSLKLDAEAVAKGKQTDLDEKGIAKTAREEKLRARKAQQENKRMAELYRQVVLKEAEAGGRDGPADSGARQRKKADDKETVTH